MENSTACLLLHGYGGAPFEMKYLSRHLQRAGVSTHIPCLPGHCSSLADFGQTRFSDWAQAAEQSFLSLQQEFEQVFVIGLSMGGALALHLGAKFQPAGVVAIAAPVYLHRFVFWQTADWKLALVPFLKWIRPVWKTGPVNPGSRQIAPWVGYEGAQMLHALHSLMKGIKDVRFRLHQINCPLLLIHALQDKTVNIGNAWTILRKVSSPKRRLEILSIQEQVTSRHVLTTHKETRKRVACLCSSFINENIA